MSAIDGMNYAPETKAVQLIEPGEVKIAAMHLDHGHINGQVGGLLAAGAELVAVYDPDPAKVQAFTKKFPQARIAATAAEILDDPTIHCVCAAAIPNERGPLGIRVMQAGKDYFTDKAPFTSHDQLQAARAAVEKTGRKYGVYYSERLHQPGTVAAGDLVQQGAIGRVIQVIGMGPHRLNAPSRPDWFFRREQYGGILTDIGSHQLEQFLYFTDNTEARIVSSRVGNFANPDYPELEDFGDLTITGGNGATGYHRVDWFTSDGLSTWGDGRLFLLGTEGHIEVRKYCDLTQGAGSGNHVYVVNADGERVIEANNAVCPFFGQFLRDILDRTEEAQSQEHAFLAAQLCLDAQTQAEWLTGDRPV